MAAVAEMPLHEQYQAEESPRRIQFRRLASGRRTCALLEAYLLADELDEKPKEMHDEIVAAWALDVNRSPGALWKEVGWARAIKEDDLKGVFEACGISEHEWSQSVGTSHLQVIGKTKEQDTDRLLTSKERADLVFECYHANWSVDELKTELRKRDLLPLARGMKAKPTTSPITLASLMVAMGTDLMERGHDMPLSFSLESWKQPKPVAAVLRWMADQYEKNAPEAMYKPVGS